MPGLRSMFETSKLFQICKTFIVKKYLSILQLRKIAKRVPLRLENRFSFKKFKPNFQTGNIQKVKWVPLIKLNISEKPHSAKKPKRGPFGLLLLRKSKNVHPGIRTFYSSATVTLALTTRTSGGNH